MALAVAVPNAGAAKPAPAPLQVDRASLDPVRPAGLTWTVKLAHRSAPGALASAKRSLCLLIERGQRRSVSGSAVRGRTAAGPPRSPALDVPVTRAGRAGALHRRDRHARELANLTATFTPASIGLGYQADALAGREHARGARAAGSPRRAPAQTGTCRRPVPAPAGAGQAAHAAARRLRRPGRSVRRPAGRATRAR